MNITRIGLDLAKHVFQVHGVDRCGQTVQRRRLQRGQVLEYFGKLQPCLVGMEACASAHYWAGEIARLGHTVKLIAPQFVKPYVKSQKNDANDAEAICEAVGRVNMRFVTFKSVAQREIQAVHRVRSALVKARTANANEIRGLAGEFGLIAPVRIDQLRRAVPIWLEQANGLGESTRQLLRGLWEDLQRLDQRVQELDQQLERLAQHDEVAKRLQSIPGIGPISASALSAAVGDGTQFKRGRDLAAWLGLTPRQHSSGGKNKLLGMTKRGDPYVRTLLIHGARSVVRMVTKRNDPRSLWLAGLITRRHRNVAAVALANKNARIAWALIRSGNCYKDALH